MRGKIERINDTTVLISELPLKKWTQDYKQFLEGLMTGQDKKADAEIKDFRENHTETTVSFTITAEASKLDEYEKDSKGLMGKFKLNGTISTSNMHLFNAEGQIVKYPNPEDIMEEFFSIRLDFYVKRKAQLVEKLQSQQLMLSNKARFVEEVCNGSLIVSNRKRDELLGDLQERGFDVINGTKNHNPSVDADDIESSEDNHDDISSSDLAKGYDYLLGMKIWTLTFEKAEALRSELAEKTKELEELVATDPSQIWLSDLDDIEQALDERDEEIRKSASDERRAQKKSQKRQNKTIAKKAGRSKKKVDEWDSEAETLSDEDVEPLDSDDDIVPSSSYGATNRRKIACKSVTKPKPAAKVAPKFVPVVRKMSTTTKPEVKAALKDDFEDSEEEECGGSLLERMRKKLVVSPPGKHAKAKKRPSPKVNDIETDSDASAGDLVDLDVADFELASVTPAKTKAQKQVTQATKRGKGTATGSSHRAISEKPAEPGSDSDSSMDIEIVKPAASRARRGRAVRKQVNYALNDEEDDDESDFEL